MFRLGKLGLLLTSAWPDCPDNTAAFPHFAATSAGHFAGQLESGFVAFGLDPVGRFEAAGPVHSIYSVRAHKTLPHPNT